MDWVLCMAISRQLCSQLCAIVPQVPEVLAGTLIGRHSIDYGSDMLGLSTAEETLLDQSETAIRHFKHLPHCLTRRHNSSYRFRWRAMLWFLFRHVAQHTQSASSGK